MKRHDPTRRRLLQGTAITVAAAASPWAVPTAAASPATRPANETGYDLWLRYHRVRNAERLAEYRATLRSVRREGDERPLHSAESELRRAITGLVDRAPGNGRPGANGVVVIGTADSSATVRDTFDADELDRLGDDGYAIRARTRGGRVDQIVVAARSAPATLHGTFHLIRLVQTATPLADLDVMERPSTPIRIVNHWDNLNRSVERGYAGRSIFDWQALPAVDDRMTDYCRALASIGINASVINNVNANARFISDDMLGRLAPLAELFADWGISLWLSLNYASPITLTAGSADEITTADPFDPDVQRWWGDKMEQIHQSLPTLGGFLVKANSEGQPGPLDYGRTHADGANMLARACAPYDSTVIWRSFVHEDFSDWAEYQFQVFAPLDGKFDDNVVLQTKYGPIDFQIREPVHPLFGELTATNQMLELQITQEYTGHDVHAVWLAPMWRSVLDFTTGGPDSGPTVGEIVTGHTRDQRSAGIAGVINFGDDTDWTGYQLGQANTYAFGRLAWDVTADVRDIASDWVRMTFGLDDKLTAAVTDILLESYDAYEDYTSPLGMGYLTNPGGSHFDPSPVGTLTQSHHTTAEGTGFDRTVATGTGFTGLYPEPWTAVYEDLATMPDELLLFMHWVRYTHVLHSGSTVIQHIYDSHFTGLETVEQFRQSWRDVAGLVDEARHRDIAASFDAQVAHARVWRDTIVSFFFDQSRIVDEHRQWLQVSLDGTGVLLGGWPNLLPASVTNASAEQVEVTVEISPPEEDWLTTPATVTVGATETAAITLSVTPPLVGTTASTDLDVQPDREVLGNTAVPLLVAPAGQLCHLALDGGTEDSPVLPGWSRLAPSAAWQDGADHGWVGAAPSSRDRGGDAIRRDFVGHPEPRTLRIRVPAGNHTVYALVGDRGADAQATTITADGTEVARTPEQPRGDFTWVDFAVDGGSDGHTVDLGFSGAGGWWRLNALAIPDPNAPLPPVIVLRADADPVWWCGRSSEVTVTVTNTSDTTQSVRVELDVPDGWTTVAGEGTVAAGQRTDVSATATPGATPGFGQVGITVLHDGEVVETGRAVNVVTTPHNDDTVLALDGGTDTSPVLDGYRRLGPQNAWTADSGYGWIGAAPVSRDRANSDVLRRDIVLGKDQPYTLRVSVPSGPHTVWVLSGDSSTNSGVTTISENGTVLGRSGTEALPARAMVWFSFTLDGGADGRDADLTLTGSLLNGYWRVAALVILP